MNEKYDAQVLVKLPATYKRGLQAAAKHDDRYIGPFARRGVMGWLEIHGYVDLPEGIRDTSSGQQQSRPLPARSAKGVASGAAGAPTGSVKRVVERFQIARAAR